MLRKQDNHILPFLKHKPQVAGIMTIERKPDQDTETQDDSGMMAAAQDLSNAIHSKDIKAIAAALRAAFEILETQPHDEISHEQEKGNE